jgi:Cupin-like domain
MTAMRETIPERVLEVDEMTFRRVFNKSSLLFEHKLGNHPLFAIPRLARVAASILERGNADNFVVLDNASAHPGTKFKDTYPQDKLVGAIDGLGVPGRWLKLTRMEQVDPDYQILLSKIIGELEILSGVPLRAEITWSSMTAFIAAPFTVTPYHIDHESNFLFQIRGEKEICLFDPMDRAILTESDIETFYLGDVEAATYRPELQHNGTIYLLDPGRAVHHPPLAPHWVKNGGSLSVSISIGFCLKSLDLRARVYQTNAGLRRLGLRPRKPGESPLGDWLKIKGVGMISKPNPAGREEILFSGINRIRTICAFARRIAGGKGG